MLGMHYYFDNSTSRNTSEDSCFTSSHHTMAMPGDGRKDGSASHPRTNNHGNHSRNWMPDRYHNASSVTSPAISDHLQRHSDPEWMASSILPPQDSSADSSDSRHIKGLVTAIDAIDNIIGPKKPKSKKSRSKPRSERTVFCEKCGSTFASVGNLNRHRRVSHQGVRVYCDFKGCKQSFSQVADLTRHRRRVHMCYTKYGQETGGSARQD